MSAHNLFPSASKKLFKAPQKEHSQQSQHDVRPITAQITRTPPSPELSRSNDIAFCFSGGGSRSMAATVGQLRALSHLGVVKGSNHIISCASGSAWCCVPYTFYQEGAKDDQSFLGPLQDPSLLTMEKLGEMGDGFIGRTLTLDYKHELEKSFSHLAVSFEKKWNHTVGQTFLAPYSLYNAKDSGIVSLFCLSREEEEDIKRRNPSLSTIPFHVPRDDRPFLVVSTVMIWPVMNLSKRENMVLFQHTPTSTGSHQLLTLEGKAASGNAETRQVGGGYIESFAFNAKVAKIDGRTPIFRCRDETVSVALKVHPLHLFSLADLAGTTSSAYALALDKYYAGLSPHITYFPFNDSVMGSHHDPVASSLDSVRSESTPNNQSSSEQPHHRNRHHVHCYSAVFGDGGLLENSAIIPMLLRKRKRILSFINSIVPLSMDFDVHHDLHPAEDEVASFLTSLFGISSYAASTTKQHTGKPHSSQQRQERKEETLHNMYPHNCVFPSECFASLITQLQQCKQAGLPPVARCNLPVQSNSYFGVEGGWNVDLCVVYLDQSDIFLQSLPEKTRLELDKGEDGPFAHFPNYLTVSQQKHALIRLSPVQVNLLSHLTAWSVLNSPVVKDFLHIPL